MDKLLAKHRETRILSSTGEPAEFVYEWRLVDVTGYNPAGKYVIKQYLTVDGEKRSTDWMAYGNTESEAVYKMGLGDSNLDKAEHYGVLKTLFVKESAAREKQKTEESKRLAEYAAD